MSRITCKQCRRFGEALCARHKCAVLRKPYPPGIHGRKRKKGRRESSDFGRQLREKQKVRLLYGLSEGQFGRYVREAIKKPGADNVQTLVARLETRLDNVVFRLGLASSPRMARLLVSHGHITIDGRRATIPSYRVRPGQTVSIASAVGEPATTQYTPPSWLVIAPDRRGGRIEALPLADDILRFHDFKAIIEYYARS